MATFTSYFKYKLIFDECTCEGFAVAEIVEVEGVGDNEIDCVDDFVLGDIINYTENSVSSEVFYLGHFGPGWVGMTCGCEGEEEYFLFSTDGTLEVGDIVTPDF